MFRRIRYRLLTPARRLVLVGLIVAWVSGCHSGRPELLVPLHPASGQVLANGQPAAGVIVQFVPLPDQTTLEKVPHPRGVTNAEGFFVLEVAGHGTGAPAGRYQVMLHWPSLPTGLRPPTGPQSDRWQGKFLPPNPPFTEIELTEGNNSISPFQVTAGTLPAPSVNR